MRFTPLRLALLTMTAVGCTMTNPKTVPTVAQVNLEKFMGPWFVIASIPTFLEKHAYNAIEEYTLNADGTIGVKFTFNEGSFDGKLKTMTPRAWVRDSSNAYWGMQFIWPIKAEYRISYVDANYSQTIIARSSRDYVWIMSRQPQLPDADYQKLVARVAELGYDTSKLRRVPQVRP